MKTRNSSLWLVALLLLTMAQKPASAMPSPSDTTGREDKADTTKLSDYQKLFDEKECETVKGLITIHKIDDKQILFEFPLDILGRDMMFGSTVSEISNNEHSVLGYKSKEPAHIRFEKDHDYVNMVNVNSLYVTEQENIREAVKKSTIGGIFKSFEIKAWNEDSTAVVFDATELFMSNIKDIDPFDPYGTFGRKPFNRSVSFQKDRSHLAGIKPFSDNFSVSSYLTYTSTVTYTSGNVMAQIETDAPVTALVNRSFLLLPKTPMRPRLADPRINIFPTGKAIFTTNDIRGTLPVYFARKWDLYPKDIEAWKRGEKVEPVKQIVFYIDDAFPEAWRGPIIEAVEQWNEAFEPIGFKNAIDARIFPTKEEDPEFDPDNLKYSCIRYQPIPVKNAMGPSWVDPRSGEIFNASVMVYHDVINLVSEWLFVQTAAADPRVRSGEIPQDIMDDALRYVIAHEVGHCLSLMHNMAGSSSIPVEKLRDPKFTQENGTTYTIMDYARFNFVAQPGDMEKGVKLTPPRLGLADYFSIKWLYSPIPEAETYMDEKPVLSKWISEKSGDPRFRYGKQQIYSVIDPSAQSEDLGDDVVKSSAYGIKNLKFIMKNMNSWLKDSDPDLTKREMLYKAVLNQYLQHLFHVYNVKGGIYLNERYQGDKRPSFELVEADYQRRAQEFLCAQLGDLDWLEPKDLLEEIPLLGNQSVKIQKLVLSFALSDKGTLDLNTKKSGFSVSESQDIVFNTLFAGTKKGKSLTSREMTDQISYIDYLMMISRMDKLEGASGSAASLYGEPPMDYAVADDRMPDAGLFPAAAAMPVCDYAGGKIDIDEITPEQILGFGYYRGLSASLNPKYHIYYAKLMEIRDLLNEKKNTGSKETQAHYRLLLHRLNALSL